VFFVVVAAPAPDFFSQAAPAPVPKVLKHAAQIPQPW